MSPYDIKKERKDLYNPSSKAFSLVDAPPMQFLMIDGAGNPNDNPAYQTALEALYGVAYTLKFALKAQGGDFVVAPPEGLWWADNPEAFALGQKERWLWTMMIWMPETVTPTLLAQAVAQAERRKPSSAYAELRLESYHEGLAAQILYIGPYAEETETIVRLHAWAESQGCALAGKHHEIYLGDPRRTAPDKLKTIIRQPVRRL
jgi:hypothetical protein